MAPRGRKETKVRVPDRYSFFTIQSVESSTARRENGDVAQLMVVSTSTNTKAADIASAIQVWLLPNKKNVEEGSDNNSSEDSDSKAIDDENKNSDSKDNDSKNSDSKDTDSNESDSSTTDSKNDDANNNDEDSSDAGSWKSPGEGTYEVLKTAQR